MKSKAYYIGVQHKTLGYSVYYNPFRHKGSSDEYLDWVAGWGKGTIKIV